MFEFRILEPVQAVRDGRELELGGPKRRVLLALLLVAAGRVVPAERLADDMWGGHPPPGAAGTLRAHVSRLRTLLAPDAVLLARGGGYALAAEPGLLDAARFEQLAGAGRDALEHGEAAVAASRFRDALGLWRGRALADVAEVEPLAREAARLEELRLVAVEGRVEADLALGRAAEVVGELEGLVAEYPVRERLWRLLVLALYRAERQVDALAAYRRARDMLAEELGIEPGEELRALEEAVLRQEVPPPATAAATRTLPRDVVSFTGRSAELRQLLRDLASRSADGGVVGICAIGGMAGIGKTTLAVRAAHQLADRFPDGQLFLPLHAHTPGQRPVDPAAALASLLLTTGLAARQIPPGVEARTARWRDYLAGKRILLVLDDAAGHGQVRPLLPGTAGSLVLITSRRRLAALEDAVVISLDTLTPAEAAALLAQLAGRPGLPAGDAAVGEITRLCGYLPLAIGMLARQLHHHPAWTTVGLAADLAAARDRLELMHAENLSVAAAFDLSYQDLTSGQQRLFRRLGLHPGSAIDAYAAAAIGGITVDEGRRGLDELYDQHLLAEPTPGRYLLHDLLREHARALAATEGAAGRAATCRLLDYYLHTALAGGSYLPTRSTVGGRPPPGRPPRFAPEITTARQAVAWLEAECSNLYAATGCAAAHGLPLHAIAIPAAISDFLRAHGHWDQAIALHKTALATAREAGDRPAQARALNLLGNMQRLTGDHLAAAATQQQALALYQSLGDQPGQADALNQLGIVQQLMGDYRAAEGSHRSALVAAREAGDRLSQAHALNNLGAVQRLGGDYPAAAASCQQALALFREIAHRLGQAEALNNLGAVQRLGGDYPAAAASCQQALALFRDIGDRPRQAEVLNSLGELLFMSRAYQRARDHHTQALAIATDLDAAQEKARALEGIGQCHLQEGNPGEGAAKLRQAIAIYQLTRAPDAQRIQRILRAAAPRPRPDTHGV
jgi:DNA-binding SARP family transcriptional activator